MLSRHESKAREALEEADAYLRSCGIRLPKYQVTTTDGIGGSFVERAGSRIRLNMGHYPSLFMRRWFAMHELGHVLWILHRPLRRKHFHRLFGDPAPDNYDEVHRQEAWKTALSRGLFRPHGEPSCYGARAGGEERFCELLSLMFATGDFSKEPPDDLGDLWNTCWNHGLSRMT